ncbi:MAG TPA: efflux RND transporter periplasmic adaptor subunit [Blastocatellia bacterium]|nr:efflux RND transporter periplasmic adaptor subunit [Blastocatellia bacterium]
MAMSRKRKYVIAGVAVVILGAIVVFSRAIQTKEGEAVQVGKVEKRARLESKVTASGDIRPVKYYDLTSEVQGRVEQIYVNEGDVVKKGQPLVRVDPTQIDAQVAASRAAMSATEQEAANQRVAVQQAETAVLQMRASLSAAEAELERSKAELQYAENEYNRYQQLVETGIATKSQFDQAKSRYDQQRAVVRANQSRVDQLRQQVKDAELGIERAKAAMRASEARVRQSQAQLTQQTDQLYKTVRKSPIDGVVSYLPVKVGQFALAGFSTTPLLTVADMSLINAEIKVDETDIADVQVGQKVKVKVDALGEVEIDGEVVEKGASAVTRSGQTITQSTSSQEAKDFIVKVRLNPPEEIRLKLRPGMSTTATITTAMVDNVLTVPLQAIVPREMPNKDGENAEQANGRKKEVDGVFLLKNGRAQFTPVTTGIKGDQEIEVKSGVNEGDEIITGPYKTLRTLKDGDVVRREAKPPAPDAK